MSRLVRSIPALLLAGLAYAQDGAASQAFTPDDLVKLKRLSDPQVSPDGRYVAYVLRETDMDANRGRTDLWLLDLQASEAEPRRLTTHPANDSSPRWSPDGRWIYFLSVRSDSTQVWRLPVAGGEAVQVTDYPLDVGTLKVSPAGDRIAVSIEVLPDCVDLACTKRALDERGKGKASGRFYDRLFVRHWDTWKEGTRSHLFTAPIGADGKAGAPVDLTRKLDADVPSKPMGGDEEYTFSPDGRRVVFSARVAGREEPWSTNFDLYESAADGSGELRNLTDDNEAWDTQPVFLRDGSLAYLAMSKPGYEADRLRIVALDARTGQRREIAANWDRSVGRLGATRDGRRLLALADDVGQHALFAVDPASGRVTKVVGTGQVTDFSATDDAVYFGWANLAAPVDLHVLRIGASTAPRRLTSVNRELLGVRALGEFEQFSFAGWNGETVYGYVVKPYGYAPGKKFPIAFIVHGGPQVSFQNLWNYRWNAQVFAGAGHGVVMIDYHGSPGYGQAFTDSINQDWGGKPLEDLRKGLDAANAKYEWLDGERACSLGASYGGFMQNWIAGNWPDRFRCLVNHAGIFDERMMYYSTEELWFPEHDKAGTPFEKPENYEKHNPALHVQRWRTPMLVTHGALDFRVPYTQGLATFTALQRRGIESEFLLFPDENHWILKPANSVQWHRTVFDWLDRFLKKSE
jgi:dipeptidyl aminopeptidase/acylaminoacyl peptidase